MILIEDINNNDIKISLYEIVKIVKQFIKKGEIC